MFLFLRNLFFDHFLCLSLYFISGIFILVTLSPWPYLRLVQCNSSGDSDTGVYRWSHCRPLFGMVADVSILVSVLISCRIPTMLNARRFTWTSSLSFRNRRHTHISDSAAGIEVAPSILEEGVMALVPMSRNPLATFLHDSCMASQFDGIDDTLFLTKTTSEEFVPSRTASVTVASTSGLSF